MSGCNLAVIEVNPSECYATSRIAELIEESMGAWQAYYAMACFNQGYCRSLVALSEVPLGVSLFYSMKLEPGYSLGVIYYVVVGREHRGRGIGRVLVASTEHILEDEGSDVVVATTRTDNYQSRRLFNSLGYSEIPLYSIEEKYGELFTKMTCSYEDDIAFVKSVRVSLAELMEALRIESNVKRIEELWYSLCYKPWRQMRSRTRLNTRTK